MIGSLISDLLTKTDCDRGSLPEFVAIGTGLVNKIELSRRFLEHKAAQGTKLIPAKRWKPTLKSNLMLYFFDWIELCLFSFVLTTLTFDFLVVAWERRGGE